MNPLVMSFRTLNSTSTFKSCAIVQDSVNSICLDEHPGNMHDRLLVAATVGMHTSGNRVVPRNTTLMPMVPGLAHIVPLIFAPQVFNRYSSCRYFSSLIFNRFHLSYAHWFTHRCV